MAKAKVQSKAKKKESTEPTDWLSLAWSLIGCLVGLALASHHVWYVYIQHENEMWFTNIKEVEREISFRTESGLYYSYFKQTIQGTILRLSFKLS